MRILRTRSRSASTLLLALGLGAQEASADCNVVPGTINAYPGNQGSSNSPFASPGDEVAISVAPGSSDAPCDSGAGLPASEADTLVTVVFTPPDGPERAVLVTEGPSCPANALSSCTTALGASNVLCVPNEDLVRDPLLPSGARLRFRFPDSHALLAPGDPNPLHTLAGPAKIAVNSIAAINAATETAPCAALATVGCSAATGARACVGELYEVDGTCERSSDHRDSSFSHFTALPIPTNYQALCETPGTPCVDRPLELPGQPDQIRFTVDADGNVLWPVNWEGILVGGAVPIPRLVQGSIELAAKAGDPDPMSIPKFGFLSAYSLQGHRLPPVFAPLGNPNAAGSVFGTADSPRGVLRIARRSSSFEQCVGGDRNGLPCSEDVDCPNGGSCGATTCKAGVNQGDLCASDLQCPGSECGPSLYEFRDRNDGLLASLDTAGLGLIAESDFVLDARNPVPLDGLVETPDLLLEVRSEPSESANAGSPVDLNADGDADDVAIVTMRDRLTGATQNIGASGSPGRAVPRVHQSLYTFPAAAAEGDVIAFLEAEQLQGSSSSCLLPPLGPGCDQNADNDSADTLLRVYRLGEGVIAGDPAAPAAAQITADPAPLVGGRSVAVSKGQVFFRASEAAAASQVETTILSSPPGTANLGDMTEDGRYLVFRSSVDIPPDDANGLPDIFVYDRDPDGNGAYDESSSLSIIPTGGDPGVPGVTPDGRFVVFGYREEPTDPWVVAVHDRASQQTVDVSSGLQHSFATTQAISDDGRLVVYMKSIGGNTQVVTIHDRDVDADGMFDEPGAVQTTELAGTATFIDDPTPRVMISGDGRWIVFDSRAALNYPLDIVTTDTNNESDVIVMDVATFTPRRMSVSTQGAQSDFASCDDHCFNSLSSISRDGRFVTFTSAADNLGTSSFLFQLLVRDRDPDGNGVFDERGAITIETSPSLGKPASLGGIMSPDGRFIPRLGDGLRIYDQATRLHDAPLPGADWFPTVLAERGRFAVGGRDTIRVRGIDTSPAATVAVDRNADGDAFDTLLGLVNTVALSPTVEWLGAAGQVEVADGNAVFLLPEVEDSAGPDLNQDGDDDDSFVRLYRKGQGVANLGRAARRVAISEHWIASIGWRPQQGVPVNEGEPSVAVYPVDGSSGWADLDLPAVDLAAAGDRIAFRVPEVTLGVDLNGDGDSLDHVLHLYDAVSGGAPVNTGLAAEEFVLGERILAFRVSEAGQGVALPGLNEDGDLLDAVLFVVDLADPEGAPFNTEQAALACPFEACDGRVPYRIAGETVTFLTREEDQGEDLNGDGDSTDILLQHFNAVSMALQSSPGAATSQFAAAPAGICTDTGESCVSDASCPDGDCVVPPGQCELIRGGSCEADADGPHCPFPGWFCRPFGGGGVAGTCFEFLGPCDRQTDCPDPSLCRNTGQEAQRLESPLDPYADGRQGLVSGGVCVETLAASCSDDEDCPPPAFCSGGSCRLQTEPCVTAADCPGNAACVQSLVLAGDSDVDGDFVAASIDNCPKHPNTDQSDVDSDRIGDRCDLQTCGDGVQQFAEQCDDGNTVAGDDCNNACQLVLGPGGCAGGLEAACSNGADDDGDGLVDFPQDGGCDGACDTSERRDISDTGLARPCDDGKDNDGDQLVDWPTDPGCLTPSSPLENPACSNGIDDDADGVLDAIDGGCGDASDRSEGPDCSDGIDNDGDGQIDHPADTHCASPAGVSEAPLCSNGLDDDGDGALDFPADPGCTSALDDDEHAPALACDDGLDGDGDGAVDFPDDPGCASLTDTTETNAALVCDNGLDDDTDGAVDFPDDPGCASWTDSSELLANAQCDDGLDRDGDALVDTDDPDCTGPDDPTEFHLSPGDILVTENTGTGKIVRVNPVGGAQTLVWESSDFFNVQDLAIDSNGDVYVIESSRNAVLRLDLEAGTQEVVSLGGFVDAPLSIDAEPRGTLVATDQTGDRVLRIDPRTGAQQILYAGLPLEAPSGISVEANGNIIVSDTGPDALFRLDPTTGAITTLVDPGASWTAPRMIDVEPEGNILVVDQAPTDEIYRVTPTGTLTLLSSGAPYNDTRGVVRSGSTIFITDIGAHAIFKFPSGGGVATTHSSGGFFGAPRGIEVVPATQCSDILDNDGDGLTNLADPDCSGPLDRTEFNLVVGDLVVANLGNLSSIDGSIVRVKPVGGAQTLLSADPRFEALEGIRIDGRGRILVTDAIEAAVFRFDPVSGRIETLARGGSLDALSGIAVEAAGTLLVSSSGTDAIARVQPETGLSTLVTGPVFADANGIEIEAAGTWLVADGASDTVERVNPITGVPTVLADAADGLDHPFHLEIEPGTGNVLIAERDDDQISRLTVATNIVSQVAAGICGGVTVPRDVALDASGDAIVTCDRNSAASGDRIRKIDLPGSTATTISTDALLERTIGLAIVKPACADGYDNDGDGLTDHPADLGCASAADTAETNPAVACDDGLDNDLDLFVDFPADPGCGSVTATTEDADCSDGEDNDGDGQTDHPADSGCTGPADLVETNAAAACDDGVDNDGDGLVDHPADPGCASPSDAAETNAAAACDDGADNDGDGFADFPDDPGCGAATDTSERTPSYACDDGVDNDGDGTADEPADLGCVGPTDASERQAGGAACDDGVDNDADSYFDYPADPGCQNAASTIEKRQCQDGLNNDNQAGIDFDGGASLDLDHNGRIDAAFNPGTPLVGAADPQCLGQGWRPAEKVGCGLGFELAPILAFLLARRRRRAA